MGFAAGMNAGTAMGANLTRMMMEGQEYEAKQKEAAQSDARTKAMQDGAKVVKTPKGGVAIDENFLAQHTNVPEEARSTLVADLKNAKDEDVSKILSMYGKDKKPGGAVMPVASQMEQTKPVESAVIPPEGTPGAEVKATGAQIVKPETPQQTALAPEPATGAELPKVAKPQTTADLVENNGQAAQKTNVPVDGVPQQGAAAGEMPQAGAAPADFMSPEELKSAYSYRGPDGKMYLTKEAMTPMSPGELMREQAIRLQQLGDEKSVTLGIQLLEHSYKAVEQEYKGKINSIRQKVAMGEMTPEDGIKGLGGVYNESGVLPGTAEAYYDPKDGTSEMRITTPDGRTGSGPGQRFKTPMEAFQYLNMQAEGIMNPEIHMKLADQRLKEYQVTNDVRQTDEKIEQADTHQSQDLSVRAQEGQLGRAQEEKLLGVKIGADNDQLDKKLKHDATQGSLDRGVRMAAIKASGSGDGKDKEGKPIVKDTPDGIAVLNPDGSPRYNMTATGGQLPIGRSMKEVEAARAAARESGISYQLKNTKSGQVAEVITAKVLDKETGKEVVMQFDSVDEAKTAIDKADKEVKAERNKKYVGEFVEKVKPESIRKGASALVDTVKKNKYVDEYLNRK